MLLRPRGELSNAHPGGKPAAPGQPDFRAASHGGKVQVLHEIQQRDRAHPACFPSAQQGKTSCSGTRDVMLAYILPSSLAVLAAGGDKRCRLGRAGCWRQAAAEQD